MLKKTLALVAFLLIISSDVFAQTQESKIADKKFWVVNSLLVGSTIYDIESTYFALDRCKTCWERNPIMRPFAESGRPALYTIQGAIGVGIIYTSYEMKKSQRFRKVWWLIPVSVTVGHITAGTLNIRLALRF